MNIFEMIGAVIFGMVIGFIVLSFMFLALFMSCYYIDKFFGTKLCERL